MKTSSLLIEVRAHCKAMLQRMLRAPSRYTKVMGQKVATKWEIKRQLLDDLKEYLDFARMEGDQEVVDYITMQVTSDEADYRQKQAELVKELKEKK